MSKARRKLTAERADHWTQQFRLLGVEAKVRHFQGLTSEAWQVVLRDCRGSIYVIGTEELAQSYWDRFTSEAA